MNFYNASFKTSLFLSHASVTRAFRAVFPDEIASRGAWHTEQFHRFHDRTNGRDERWAKKFRPRLLYEVTNGSTEEKFYSYAIIEKIYSRPRGMKRDYMRIEKRAERKRDRESYPIRYLLSVQRRRMIRKAEMKWNTHGTVSRRI